MYKSTSTTKNKNSSHNKPKKQVKHSVSKSNIWKCLCDQAKEGMWIPNKRLERIQLSKEEILL